MPKKFATITKAKVAEKLEDNEGLSPPLIYEAVRRDGESELRRPVPALFWSGAAAGVLICASIVGEAIFRAQLPEQPWRPLIESMGYTFGFLLVILGRMQLFTENTITTVFPLVTERSMHCTVRVARLWCIVLGANVIGATLAAAMLHSSAVTPEVYSAIGEISEHAVTMGAYTSFMRGIPAGLIIAAIVWMLAQKRGSEFLIIFAFTWLIAAADLTHIVAGSVEYAFLVLGGELGLLDGFLTFFLPTLAGNIIGGTLVFSMLAWAQVRQEIEEEELADDGSVE